MRNYAAFSIIFTPFLFPYYFPYTTINMSVLFMLCNGMLFFIYNHIHKIHTVWPKFFKLFVCYSLITPFIGFFFYGKTSAIYSTYVTILPLVLCLIEATPLISWEIIKKYYRRAVYCCIAFFIVQEIMYYSMGWRLMGLIPVLDVSYSYITMQQFIENMSHLNRSMSFFLEPAHYAQYVLGYLAVTLGDNYKHNRLYSKESVIITIALLLTWSGTAILLTLILWIVSFIFYKKNPIIKYFIVLPMTSAIAIIAVFYISNTEMGKNMLDRQSEISSDQERMSSGMIRIYRGYFVFSDMNFFEKTLGVGTGTCPEVIEKSRYLFMFYSFERYLNTAQILLIGDGIIGTFLFLLFLLGLTSRKNPYARLMISLLIGLSFLEGFWMSGRMLLYLELAYVSSLKDKIDTLKVK